MKTNDMEKRMKTSLLAMACLACTFASCAVEAAPEPPPIRVAYNYCTLSYTFAYYSDAEWDAEIERLAKAGYNAALVTDGTFKVWQATLRELGYDEKAIAAFIPDECARAWWLMDNLSGEGGPLDHATIDEDGARGRRICAKMRAKGIEPILQGFYGMMPKGDLPQGKWGSYERPPMVDPTGPAFAQLAAVWYRNLESVYGFKPKYLAGDLFHEGGNSKGVDVTAAARAVQKAQQTAFPGVTWVVQAWQKNPTPELRKGLDPRYTLIEALVMDMSAFANDNATCDLQYDDLPWVWCEVQNFGGNHGLYGNLKTFASLGRAAKGKGAKTFRGYGALSEGFFTNPVCSDLFEEMMMRPVGSEMTDAELAAWLDRWVERRYGSDDARLKEAWKILAETAYACPRCQEGAVDNVMCAKPAWGVNRARTWAPKGGLYYDAAKLEKALELMASAEASCASADYKSDLYDLRRQVAANRCRALVPSLKDNADERARFLKEAEALAALDAPAEFRLATWESRARERAGERGVNAWRRMITKWNDTKFGHTRLEDYANREYPELLRDYYIPRWREFFGNEAGGPCVRAAVVPAPREATFKDGEFHIPPNYTPTAERVAGIPAEGYELSVTPDGVTIRACDAAGEFYARQTLAQLKNGATFPCCEIKDGPRFKWRGVMIDDVRHFMGKEQVKRTIDEMARYKFNVFHWHLTDDQSWRIDVPGYPELLDYGDQYSLMTDKARRVRMATGPRAGGRYYTADDIREIVAFARGRHIKIVPEIDFPGHFYAVLCAYPEFACKPENVYSQGRWPMVEGWHDGREPMCVANPDAVKFVEAALDAVCDLFPDSDIIHIGGDECHFEFWKDCPKCQAMMAREGMTRPQELQAWLTRRVVRHLEKRGRRAIGWDEILDANPGVLPPATMGMRWHPKGVDRTVRAAKAGHDIVNSAHRYCYFDKRQGLKADPYRYIGGNLPLGLVYAFDPIQGLSPEFCGKVVGGQCNNWAEFTYDGKDLEWKLWPRGLAIAEVLWTYPDPKKRDFADFKRRAAVRRDEMVSRGVNAAPVN